MLHLHIWFLHLLFVVVFPFLSTVVYTKYRLDSPIFQYIPECSVSNHNIYLSILLTHFQWWASESTTIPVTTHWMLFHFMSQFYHFTMWYWILWLWTGFFFLLPTRICYRWDFTIWFEHNIESRLRQTIDEQNIYKRVTRSTRKWNKIANLQIIIKRYIVCRKITTLVIDSILNYTSTFQNNCQLNCLFIYL